MRIYVLCIYILYTYIHILVYAINYTHPYSDHLASFGHRFACDQLMERTFSVLLIARFYLLLRPDSSGTR